MAGVAATRGPVEATASRVPFGMRLALMILVTVEIWSLIGWSCVAWTLWESAGLVVRARRIARLRMPPRSRFRARDARGDAIDIDVMP